MSTMIVCWSIVQQTSYNKFNKEGQLFVEVGMRIRNWIMLVFAFVIKIIAGRLNIKNITNKKSIKEDINSSRTR